MRTGSACRRVRLSPIANRHAAFRSNFQLQATGDSSLEIEQANSRMSYSDCTVHVHTFMLGTNLAVSEFMSTAQSGTN